MSYERRSARVDDLERSLSSVTTRRGRWFGPAAWSDRTNESQRRACRFPPRHRVGSRWWCRWSVLDSGSTGLRAGEREGGEAHRRGVRSRGESAQSRGAKTPGGAHQGSIASRRGASALAAAGGTRAFDDVPRPPGRIARQIARRSEAESRPRSGSSFPGPPADTSHRAGPSGSAPTRGSGANSGGGRVRSRGGRIG